MILNGTCFNLEESAAKLTSLLSDSETQYRCRTLAEKNFNMDVGAHKYLDLYAQILNTENTGIEHLSY